jgi:hypothetical protein
MFKALIHHYHSKESARSHLISILSRSFGPWGINNASDKAAEVLLQAVLDSVNSGGVPSVALEGVCAAGSIGLDFCI